jgi:cytochrome b561
MGIIDNVLAVFRGYNLVLREYGNGVVFPLCVVLMLVLARYIWQSYTDDPRGWRNKPGMATAIAFWWIFVAEGIRSGSAWAVLNAQNESEPLVGTSLDWASLGFTVGVTLLVIILLRCLFMFTANRRNANALLFASILFTAAFLFLGNIT